MEWGTCNWENHSPQGYPPFNACASEELKHVNGGKCIKYVRIPLDNVIYPNAANAKKPYGDNWSKYEGNFMCSMMLKREKPHQNDTWDRNNIVWKNQVIALSDIGKHSTVEHLKL